MLVFAYLESSVMKFDYISALLCHYLQSIIDGILIKSQFLTVFANKEMSKIASRSQQNPSWKAYFRSRDVLGESGKAAMLIIC